MTDNKKSAWNNWKNHPCQIQIEGRVSLVVVVVVAVVVVISNRQADI